MILSDFVMTHTSGKNALDWVFFAEVTVTTTTGKLWWKKSHSVKRLITREYCGFWHFVDDGTPTPTCQADELERSYIAKKRLEE